MTRRICRALFVVTLILIYGTAGAIDNGYPGYIQFWVLVGVVGFAVAGAVEIETEES